MTAIIRTYGLLWDNRLVNWKGKRGRGGTPLQLLGSTRSREAKEDHCIDFSEQVGFYALYDEDKRVIYVGQAGGGNNRLGNRLRRHLSDELMGRWRYFSWFGLGYVKKQDNTLDAEASTFSTQYRAEILDPIEGILINLVEPPLNQQRGNLRSHDVKRYYQYGFYKKWIGGDGPHQP